MLGLPTPDADMAALLMTAALLAEDRLSDTESQETRALLEEIGRLTGRLNSISDEAANLRRVLAEAESHPSNTGSADAEYGAPGFDDPERHATAGAGAAAANAVEQAPSPSLPIVVEARRLNERSPALRETPIPKAGSTFMLDGRGRPAAQNFRRLTSCGASSDALIITHCFTVNRPE